MPPEPPSRPAESLAARRAREAEALRENLRRRNQQRRARAEATPKPAPATAPPERPET